LGRWLRLALAPETPDSGLFRSDHYGSIHHAGESWARSMLGPRSPGLAARTERLRLGTLVSPTTFRPASVLAKSVVTVDHISGGRVRARHRPAGLSLSTPRMTSRSRRHRSVRRFEASSGDQPAVTDATTSARSRSSSPTADNIVGGRPKRRARSARPCGFADEYKHDHASIRRR